MFLSFRDLVFSQSQESKADEISHKIIPNTQSSIDNITSIKDDRNKRHVNSSSPTKVHFDLNNTNLLDDDSSIYSNSLQNEVPQYKKLLRPNSRRVYKQNMSDEYQLLYKSCPEIQMFPTDRFYRRYLDNMNMYLKFHSHDINVQERLDILASLWKDCYYSNDWEGAFTSIYFMRHAGSLEFTDLYMLIDVLRHGQDCIPKLKLLANAAIGNRLDQRFILKRRQLLQLFTDAYISMSNYEEATELLKSKSSDPAYYECPELNGVMVSLVCRKCVELAYDIQRLISTSKDNISMSFIRCIDLVDEQSKSMTRFVDPDDDDMTNIEMNKIKSIFEESRLVKQDLKECFSSLMKFHKINSVDAAMYVNVYKLIVEYLQGTKQCDRLSEYVDEMLNDNSDIALVNVGLKWKLQEDWLSIDDNCENQFITLLCKLATADAVCTTKKLYLNYLLHVYDDTLVSYDALVATTFDVVEYESSRGNKSKLSLQQLFLWKQLAALITKLKYKTLNEGLDPSSDCLPYLQPRGREEFNVSSENTIPSDSIRRSRYWWTESILSAFNLGPFVDYIFEKDADIVVSASNSEKFDSEMKLDSVLQQTSTFTRLELLDEMRLVALEKFDEIKLSLFTNSDLEISNSRENVLFECEEPLDLQHIRNKIRKCHGDKIRFVEFSDEQLELLCYQMIVCGYLQGTSDCLFIARGVQVIIQHTIDKNCLQSRKSNLYHFIRILETYGINIVRACRLALMLGINGV